MRRDAQATAERGTEIFLATRADDLLCAVIEGGEPGRTICFRADMDALPITEASMAGPTTEPTIAADCCVMCGSGRNAPPWQQGNGTGKHEAPAPAAAVEKPAWSSVDGVSHACGHDGHMAMLLIAGRMIAERRRTLHGKVVLLFQPAEERHPINNPMGGAIRMIRDQAAGAELARLLTPSSESAFVGCVGCVGCDGAAGSISKLCEAFRTQERGRGGVRRRFADALSRCSTSPWATP